MTDATPFMLRPPSPVPQAILLSVPEPLLHSPAKAAVRQGVASPASLHPSSDPNSVGGSSFFASAARRRATVVRNSHNELASMKSIDAVRDERKRQRSLVKTTTSLSQQKRVVDLEREVILSKLNHMQAIRTAGYSMHRRVQAREVVQPCLTRKPISQATVVRSSQPKSRPKWNCSPFKPSPGALVSWEAPGKQPQQGHPQRGEHSQSTAPRRAVPVVERSPAKPPNAAGSKHPPPAVVRSRLVKDAHSAQHLIYRVHTRTENGRQAVDIGNWSTPPPPARAADVVKMVNRTRPPAPLQSTCAATPSPHIPVVSKPLPSVPAHTNSPAHTRRTIHIPRLRLPRQPPLPPVHSIPSPTSSSSACSSVPVTGETYSRGDSSEGDRVPPQPLDMDAWNEEVIFPDIPLPSNPTGVQIRRRPIAGLPPTRAAVPAGSPPPRKPVAPILAFQHTRVPRPSELWKGIVVHRRPISEVEQRQDRALGRESLSAGDEFPAPHHHHNQVDAPRAVTTPNKQPRMGVLHRLDSLQNVGDGSLPPMRYYKTPEKAPRETGHWESEKTAAALHFAAKRVRPLGVLGNTNVTRAPFTPLKATEQAVVRRRPLSTGATSTSSSSSASRLPVKSPAKPRRAVPSVKAPQRVSNPTSANFSSSGVLVDRRRVRQFV